MAAARRAGLDDVTLDARSTVDRFFGGPFLRFPRQGQIDAISYLAGLVRAVERRGGRIFGRSPVRDVAGGRPARAVTRDGWTVAARAVVVATNTPFNDRLAIHGKQAAYTTYALAARVPRDAVPRVLAWDTADPYHYVRLTDDVREPGAPSGGGASAGELLIVGGEDHKTGQADDFRRPHARLESWTRAHFPMVEEVAFRWSGEVMETIDGLAYIGRNPGDDPNVFVATGDSGHGMTHGTIAGMLLCDLIDGRTNPWQLVYDPARLPMRAAPELAREGTNVALQYARWVRGGDATSVDEVLPGEGAIVRSGVDLLAVHRDDDGRVHARRAMCPHLGCVVSWNAFEKTWDCPCHGSRFDRFGELIHGPAQRGLARVDDAGADGFAVRAASAVLDAALRSASMAAALALRALRAIRRGEAGPGAR